MQTSALRIRFHGLDPSPDLAAAIRGRAEWLARRFGDVARCDVEVDAPLKRHHRRGSRYEVKLRLTTTAGPRVVRERGADPYLLVGDAFDTARLALGRER